MDDPLRQLRIITRSPDQYDGLLEDVSVEGNEKSLKMYRGRCVVFVDMLDSNQKLIDPFFTRGRHKLCDVYYLSQSYFDVPKKTIGNNSNIKIFLLQQTLKDVEHIYRNIAGFIKSYDEFKDLCREAWNENITN